MRVQRNDLVAEHGSALMEGWSIRLPAEAASWDSNKSWPFQQRFLAKAECHIRFPVINKKGSNRFSLCSSCLDSVNLWNTQNQHIIFI